MSFFGVNVKKIRVVKKLNQTEFAKLFNLTRSAVGAYEEGRAEAKIDKIIEIANYFGIDLTKFLTKKLTINEIFKYDEKKVTALWNSSFVPIPLIEGNKVKQYLENYNSMEYAKRLPKICIPDVDERYRAFEFKNSSNFLDNEILICCLYEHKPQKDDLYLLVSSEGFDLNKKISQRKKYLQIWVVKQVVVRGLHKLENQEKLEEIIKKLDK